MKITTDHFTILAAAVQHTLTAHPDVIAAYRTAGLSEMRLRWDLLWASERYLPEYWITNTLYSYLSDAHIDTALKKILSAHHLMDTYSHD
jgi:hypothetical protein